MKSSLLLTLLGALGAFALVSCSASSSSEPLRTNNGVNIYSPPGDVGYDSRPAAPC